MILTDAIRVLTQLKQENGQLKELNKYLQERIVKYESTSSYHMFQMHQAQQLQLQREFALRHAATRAGGTKGNDEGTTTAVVGAGGGGAGGEAAAPPAVAPPAAPPSAAPSAPADLAKDPSALAALLSAHPLAGLMGHPIAGLMGAGPGAAMGLAALQQQLRTASALGAAGSVRYFITVPIHTPILDLHPLSHSSKHCRSCRYPRRTRTLWARSWPSWRGRGRGPSLGTRDLRTIRCGRPRRESVRIIPAAYDPGSLDLYQRRPACRRPRGDLRQFSEFSEAVLMIRISDRDSGSRVSVRIAGSIGLASPSPIGASGTAALRAGPGGI